MVSLLAPPVTSIDTNHLVAIAGRASEALSKLRDQLLEPLPRKEPPSVSGNRLAQLLGIEPKMLNYRVKRSELPGGTVSGNGHARQYMMDHAQEIVRMMQTYPSRPANQPGAVLAVGNFKGGVGKTTNAVALAQGLTLHGHKVLLIDLDPQASATTIMGYLPDAEVPEEATIMPLVYGEQPDLAYAVQDSYWPNLDFIPSSPALFGADFFLPNRQASEPDFAFWKIMSDGLVPLREQYDVIVIDTPPTLSYLAIASFMASDGVLVPLPPETLDYTSSTQFFRQFSDLFQSMDNTRGVKKSFAFIKLFLSKVKDSASTTNIVRGWIRQTYPDILATAEVLESDVVKNASAQFKTIYDIGTYDGSAKTFQRARDSFDALVDEVDVELQRFWNNGGTQ